MNLADISLVDDLAAAFPATCEVTVSSLTSDDFIVNPSFNGTTVTELLAAGNDLPVGDKGAVLLTINVVNCDASQTSFFNTATAQGTAPDGSITDDISDDGADPDPNGDGNPEGTDESDPTPIMFSQDPILGVTKRVSQGPTLDVDDYYLLTYEIRLENLGDVDLELQSVIDDLAATFNGAQDWMVVGVESEEFAVNVNYNGITDLNLITAGEILMPGEEGAIYLTVRVAPGGNPGPYFNTATGNAVSPGGTPVTDDSQDGTNPDPDGDGDPTNDDDPTPVYLDCYVDILCPAVADTITVDNDLGWCQAFVNFPPAEIITCAAAPDSLIEFKLEGVGAMDVPLDTWIEGQPSGLMYNVGLTKVSIRASIPSIPELGYSEYCTFYIEVLDKEDPEILCQDITVPVGADCEFILTPDRLDAGTTDNCTAPESILCIRVSLDNINYTP